MAACADCTAYGKQEEGKLESPVPPKYVAYRGKWRQEDRGCKQVDGPNVTESSINLYHRDAERNSTYLCKSSLLNTDLEEMSKSMQVSLTM